MLGQGSIWKSNILLQFHRWIRLVGEHPNIKQHAAAGRLQQENIMLSTEMDMLATEVSETRQVRILPLVTSIGSHGKISTFQSGKAGHPCQQRRPSTKPWYDPGNARAASHLEDSGVAASPPPLPRPAQPCAAAIGKGMFLFQTGGWRNHAQPHFWVPGRPLFREVGIPSTLAAKPYSYGVLEPFFLGPLVFFWNNKSVPLINGSWWGSRQLQGMTGPPM